VAFAGVVPQHYLDAMDPIREEADWRTRIAQAQWPSSGVLVAETGTGIVGFASFAEDNERARRFYESAGWRADGTAVEDTTGGASLNKLRYRRPIG
jgi:hypothetical protein